MNEDELEDKVLKSLAEAWNNFIKLPSTHPDDNPDFRRAIHECQRIIGVRRLRRLDPTVWMTYE